MSSVRSCSVLTVVLILLGCDSGRAIGDPDPDPDPPNVPDKPDCNSRTETAPHECTTWTPAGGPYVLLTSINMDALTIEAGTVVRAGAGVQITVAHLIVNGTADAPVQFTALDPDEPWGGISGPIVSSPVATGSAILRHVRIQNTHRALDLGTATIEDTHIHDTQGDAITVWGGGDLKRVTIERARGEGIALRSGSRIEDAVIRNSGSGISLGRRNVLYISGGAIEDNDGDGIAVHFEFHLGGSVIFEAPVSITRNGGYPLRVPLSSMRGVLSDHAAQQMMTGNARDTIIAFAGSTWGGGASTGPLNLYRTLPVRVQVNCDSGFEAMTLMPGSLLILEPSSCFGLSLHRKLPTIAGTAEEPVTIHGGGLTFGIPPIDTARVVHARLHNLNVFSPETPVVMEDVELDSVALHLDGPGSRLLRVRSTRGGFVPAFIPAYSAITLGNAARLEHTIVENAITEGVRIVGDGVAIRDCTIRGSAQHGVYVEQGSVRVERCNLESNAGEGVHNATGTAIDATDNWWGDPAGPLGPAGDGVSADVVYEPFSSTSFGMVLQNTNAGAGPGALAGPVTGTPAVPEHAPR